MLQWQSGKKNAREVRNTKLEKKDAIPKWREHEYLKEEYGFYLQIATSLFSTVDTDQHIGQTCFDQTATITMLQHIRKASN